MGRGPTNIPLEKLDEYRWRIPSSYMRGMRVDGRVYADEKLMKSIKTDQSLQQVANVAHLPGIVKHSLAMPDIHWGYGFPIGGVAATDPENGGVISPGGVGYDINCGVRLLRTNLKTEDVDLTLTARGRRLATAEPSVLQSLTESLGGAVVRMDVTGNVYDPQVKTSTFPVIKEAVEILGTKQNESK